MYPLEIGKEENVRVPRPYKGYDLTIFQTLQTGASLYFTNKTSNSKPYM